MVGRAGAALIGALCIGIATIASFLPVAEAGAAEPDADAARVAAAINEKPAKLVSQPHTIELLPEKAMHVRLAIQRDDFATARQTVADMLAASHMQNWRFYPFDEFMKIVPDLSDAEFESHLNKWVEQNRGDAIPVLMRARYYLDIGWMARGYGSPATRSATEWPISLII